MRSDRGVLPCIHSVGIPNSLAALTWLVISAMSGEMTTVTPVATTAGS